HARVCSTLPVKAEDEWRRHGARPWLTRGALTVASGGAIGLTYATRDREPSRPIATVAGVVGVCLTGTTAVALGAIALGKYDGHGEPDIGVQVVALLSGVAGGVLGGFGAHALAASPSARAPVTA